MPGTVLCVWDVTWIQVAATLRDNDYILCIKKPRHRGVEKVAQGHTSRNGIQIQVYLIPKPIHLTVTILKKLSPDQDYCALSNMNITEGGWSAQCEGKKNRSTSVCCVRSGAGDCSHRLAWVSGAAWGCTLGRSWMQRPQGQDGPRPNPPVPFLWLQAH